MRRRLRHAVLSLAAVLAAYTGGTFLDGPDEASASARISALTIQRVTTPKLPVPHYRTSGKYPQIRGPNTSLGNVNRALRQAILDEQRRYALDARKQVASMPESLLRRYYGIFATSPRSGLMSASTVVASALIPTLELYPGGNDGSVWISVTVLVPSGARVELSDLFAHPARGLRALALGVKTALLKDKCVMQSFRAPIGSEYYQRGLAPLASNYRHFAMTSRGLVIGFPITQVAGPPCGRVEATVSYSALRPYLSALGMKLVAGVRSPR
jgi:hypothetical protein